MNDDKWKGIIISEGLEEPSLIDDFEVYKAKISKRELNIDYNGNKARWHFYWVRATDAQIEKLQEQIKKGWYAHFWKANEIISVFSNRKFSFRSDDKSTWEEVVDYGISVGISEEELGFPTG